MKRSCLRRVIPALTALSLLVSLSGCASALQALFPEQENPPESSASSLPEGGEADNTGGLDWSETFPASPGKDIEQDSYHALCGQLQESGAIAGIAFLGHVNTPLRQEEYLDLLQRRDYLEEYAFLTDIPADRIIHAPEGHQLFCIVPAGPDVTVTVNEWLPAGHSAEEGEPGEVLGHSDGKPLLLIGGLERTLPNLQVSLENKDEKILIVTCPALAPSQDVLMDTSDYLLDFTQCILPPEGDFVREPATPEVLQGNWIARNEYGLDGTPQVCNLRFYRNDAGKECAEYYYGPTLGAVYARMDGKFVPSAPPGSWVTEDMSIFSMELVGGSAMETGLPPDPGYNDPFHFYGIFNIYYYPELDVIEIVHQFNRPLIPGRTGHSILFERKADEPQVAQQNGSAQFNSR